MVATAGCWAWSRPFRRLSDAVTLEAPGRALRAVVPGLALVAALVAVAAEAHSAVPWISSLTFAVILGIALRNTVGVPRSAAPGVRLAGRTLLRVGVAMLGLQLAVGDVVGLGLGPVVAVATGLAAVFLATVGIGRRMGLPTGRAMLIGAGVAVCGAAAVAAMSSVLETDEDDTATAVAVVTLYGSLAIVLLPLLAHGLGLDDREAGAWAGASVHEVAQVVAAVAPFGEAALLTAVIVKLLRVLLLAPLIAGVAWSRRRAAGTDDAVRTLVPWFVAAFLAAVLVRSAELLSEDVLAAAATTSQLLLAAALVGLGTGVNLRQLVLSGGPPLLLGLLASAIAVLVGLGSALTV